MLSAFILGGYWMQTGGVIDGTIRLFGVSLPHGVWMYRLANMNFPQSIPAATFIPPATQ